MPIIDHASVDFADSSLQFIMRETVNAFSSLIPDASLFSFFTFSIFGQIVAAFAGDASIIVERLAVFYITKRPLFMEGLPTLFT